MSNISKLTGTVSGNPLISVSALHHIKKNDGEALIFSNRLFPFITRLKDISTYDNEQYEVRQLKKRPIPKESSVNLENTEETTEKNLCLSRNLNMNEQIFRNKTMLEEPECLFGDIDIKKSQSWKSMKVRLLKNN